MNVTNIDIEQYKNKLVIYRIYNIESNKCYIGKCSNGLNRVIDHLRVFHNPKQDYRAKLLYRAIRKHGIINFNYEIIYIANTEEELNLKEIEYIEKFNSINPNFGYNLTKGGTGGNTWGYLSENDLQITTNKLSESLKKYWSDDNKSLTRRKQCSENLKMIRKDPIKSLKNKQICSERMKKYNLEYKEKANQIKVICIETNKVYNSLCDAAKDNNICSGSYLGQKINQNKKIKGLTFKKL